MPVYVISKKGLKFATASDNILGGRFGEDLFRVYSYIFPSGAGRK